MSRDSSRSSRRRFIKHSAVAGIGVGALGRIPGVFGQEGPNQRVNVAVMGVNSRGDVLAQTFAGAAGAAGIAALSAGMNTATAENKPPDRENLRTNSKTGVRTAIITDAQLNIGPFLAEIRWKLRRRRFRVLKRDDDYPFH